MSAAPGHAPFHVGDRVRIEFGRGKVTGEVVEERGPIGGQGSRLYQVLVPMEPFEPMLMELREDEMEVANGTATPTIGKQQIINYLGNGGLVAMLQANTAGGKNQPRAWLCLDTLGNATHTFRPERGLIGGQVIPFAALREGKVFAPKREMVESFVESFGLNRREAASIVATTGVSP